MVRSLTYNKLRVVLETWASFRKIPNYRTVGGSMVYRKFFQKCPEAKTLFGWRKDADPNSKEFYEARTFVAQSTLYIRVLDDAFDMMGPDIELLTDILEELGERHWQVYRVTAEMYEPMGEALREVLMELLGEKQFSSRAQRVWREVWSELAGDMMRAELEDRRNRRDLLLKQMQAHVVAKAHMARMRAQFTAQQPHNSSSSSSSQFVAILPESTMIQLKRRSSGY